MKMKFILIGIIITPNPKQKRETKPKIKKKKILKKKSIISFCNKN